MIKNANILFVVLSCVLLLTSCDMHYSVEKNTDTTSTLNEQDTYSCPEPYVTMEDRENFDPLVEALNWEEIRNPQIPPHPPQENRAHVHEPGQNIRIDQSEV